MRLPAIRGLIDRRILVNYRIDPEVAAGVLPAPFRPQLVDGWAIGGICLIRLRAIRPAWAPAWLGIASENAAHRLAMEWDEAGALRQGVYIPRRDTSSWLNTLAGGRIFPGMHHHARFEVDERDDRYRLRVASDDSSMYVSIDAACCQRLPEDSAFDSLETASRFFQRGSLGYSPAASTHGEAACYEGLELKTATWHVRSLAVRHVRSSYFENPAMFPAGSVHFDSALLMRNVEHQWHQRPSLTSGKSLQERIAAVA